MLFSSEMLSWSDSQDYLFCKNKNIWHQLECWFFSFCGLNSQIWVRSLQPRHYQWSPAIVFNAPPRRDTVQKQGTGGPRQSGHKKVLVFPLFSQIVKSCYIILSYPFSLRHPRGEEVIWGLPLVVWGPGWEEWWPRGLGCMTLFVQLCRQWREDSEEHWQLVCTSNGFLMAGCPSKNRGRYNSEKPWTQQLHLTLLCHLLS